MRTPRSPGNGNLTLEVRKSLGSLPPKEYIHVYIATVLLCFSDRNILQSGYKIFGVWGTSTCIIYMYVHLLHTHNRSNTQSYTLITVNLESFAL